MFNFRKHKIRIIYKSGVTQDFECNEFSANKNVYGELSSLTWKDATPDPMFISVANVESVWQLR